jgi:hypothetical protein
LGSATWKGKGGGSTGRPLKSGITVFIAPRKRL